MSKLNSLVIATLTLGAISFAFLACGGSESPPKLPAEVPMDQGSSGSTPSSDSASTTAAPANPPPSSDADPSAAMMAAGSDPSAAATPPPASDPSAPDDKSGKGKKGKKGAAAGGGGGQLSKSECQGLSDKGIDLLVAGMGLDPSQAAQIKAQAAGDPNMTGMMAECLKSTTRSQYKCGMAATNKADWETCLK